MKIIEGLKHLKNIERKIYNNNKNITKYSTMISCERPIFDTVDEQQNKVNELINENISLIEEYLELKHNIDLTNNTVLIKIDDQTRTINQFLCLKRKVGELILLTYKSLNEEYSQKRFNDFRGNNIYIQRLYQENDKQNNIKYWQNIIDEIEGKLEVYNAITDILNT